jgi:hypothetical protein
MELHREQRESPERTLEEQRLTSTDAGKYYFAVSPHSHSMVPGGFEVMS